SLIPRPPLSPLFPYTTLFRSLPVFYYHFVLIFLESTTRHRRSLVAAYALAVAFSIINLSGTALFMSGVKTTYWGWAPATGILYTDRKSTRLNSSHDQISYAVF